MNYLDEVDKYIHDNKYKILPESAWFCRRRCKKTFGMVFGARSCNSCSLTKHER